MLIKYYFKIMWYRDGINQYIDGIINKPIKVLNQFKDKLNIEVEGSNTENKFVIIFKIYLKIYF